MHAIIRNDSNSLIPGGMGDLGIGHRGTRATLWRPHKPCEEVWACSWVHWGPLPPLLYFAIHSFVKLEHLTQACLEILKPLGLKKELSHEGLSPHHIYDAVTAGPEEDSQLLE